MADKKNELAVSFGGKKIFNHMSTERPNFNTESSKSEQEPPNPDFLKEQIHLLEAQWNEKFRQLIQEKIRENQLEKVDEPEESPEVLRERTFKRYIEGLGLDESKLRGKKILDLGSGGGEFVKSLIEKGVTPEAYGIDAELDESSVEDELKPHLFRGNFEEDLPVKNADYVISVGAVSNGIWGGEEVMNIRRIVEKSLASLKENGEIRIYPIQEAAKATPLEGLKKSQQKWNELLAEISEAQEVECKIKPRNVKVTGNSNDIILESVLVIRKQPIFNPETSPPEPEKKEPMKSEKEILWEQKRAEIDNIADSLGKGIDDKIKETVTAFQVHEFTTDSSCEGHIAVEGEEEHGESYPWVVIYAPEPKGWKESEEKQREWTTENLKQQQKMMGILEEFYRERETPLDARLTLDKIGVFGGFSVQSFGAEKMIHLSLEERKLKLELYRKEMDDFTKFLKDRYLSRE